MLRKRTGSLCFGGKGDDDIDKRRFVKYIFLLVVVIAGSRRQARSVKDGNNYELEVGGRRGEVNVDEGGEGVSMISQAILFRLPTIYFTIDLFAE